MGSITYEQVGRACQKVAKDLLPIVRGEKTAVAIANQLLTDCTLYVDFDTPDNKDGGFVKELARKMTAANAVHAREGLLLLNNLVNELRIGRQINIAITNLEKELQEKRR